MDITYLPMKRGFGKPAIFNTDLESQFTGAGFIALLKQHEIQISMDGKGCWRDNVFVERLWQTVYFKSLPHKSGHLCFADEPQQSCWHTGQRWVPLAS